MKIEDAYNLVSRELKECKKANEKLKKEWYFHPTPQKGKVIFPIDYIPKEKVRTFVSIIDKIMKDCFDECEDFCGTCATCLIWEEYNNSKKQLLGEK